MHELRDAEGLVAGRAGPIRELASDRAIAIDEERLDNAGILELHARTPALWIASQQATHMRTNGQSRFPLYD